METIQLTPTNALYTYTQRCKLASKSFIAGLKYADTLGQEYIAQTVAMFYQVAIVDMLAETNEQ